MRLALLLPTDRVDAGAEFVSGEAVAAMARAAEQAGFDAVTVTDHPAPPARWVAAGGHHSLDPFVALSFAAAATARIHLLTQVVVLPYRHPLLLAKAAASLDALSNGRLILGVAAGYLAPEFAALGADFARRNEAADEAIALVRTAWRGEPFDVEATERRATGVVQLPRPAQPNGPPIWVGGNARRAIRRAVELGDGWMPFPAAPSLARHAHTAALDSMEDLRAGIAHAREHAEKIGRRAPLDVCVMPFGWDVNAPAPGDPARLRDELATYADAGVTWLGLTQRAATRAAWCDAVAALGERLTAAR